jgi:hypothetical protein
MHEGKPYGHLKVGDKVIHADNLARMVGETLDVVEGWLKELSEAGVFDLTTEGVIFSRRMVRDENLRQIRALGGKLGGNPALMDKGKVNHKVIPEDKQKPTPSSSSSSSSSNVEKQPPKRLPVDWVPTEDQISFCKTERPDLNAKVVAETFKDYWTAQPDSKAKKVDWDATWRNWVRSQSAVGSVKAASSNGTLDWFPKRARNA